LVTPAAVVDSSGVSRDWYRIEPFNGAVVPNSVSAIAGGYEYYRIKHCSVEVIPSGGSLYVGTVQLAFVNSSELIHNYAGLSNADKDTLLTNQQGSSIMSTAVGGKKVYDPSRITGRKWYAMDYNTSSSADQVDRTVESMLITRASTTEPAGGFPKHRYIMHVSFEFTGLAVSDVYTLASLNGGPVLNYDGDLPDKLWVRNRQEKREYEVIKPPPEPKPLC